MRGALPLIKKRERFDKCSRFFYAYYNAFKAGQNASLDGRL